MSAVPSEEDFPLDDDDDDLLPDSLKKGSAVPLVRTPAQIRAEAKRAEAAALSQQAARLAQIVNLHIGGYSLADIGASIGATEAEVDRLLANETQRYVRNQPALRTYVRNYVSGKYSNLLDAVWDKAVDKNSPTQLEHVDRAQRILAQMGRLHGAEAPTQTEMKIEAAPEAVERLVKALAAGQGLDYDTDIFDAEVIEDDIQTLKDQSAQALEVSRNQVEESDGNDEF